MGEPMRADKDKLIEDRMTPALMRALRPILFAFEEQDGVTQAENTRILEGVARAAWKEFRSACEDANAPNRKDSP
jgi:hypothetical protein